MKNNTKKLLIIFMILQPIFDIYYLYTDNIINIFKFSPATIIRIIIFLVLLFLTFTKNKSIIKKRRAILLVSIYFIYTIMHHLNCLNFDTFTSINNAYSTAKELFYLIRMLVPLILIYISYNQELTINDLKKVILIVLNTFCTIIIITNFFKISLTSYYNGSQIIKANFFDWFTPATYEKYTYELVASKGIFHMANQISGTIIILYPLLVYIYFQEKSKLINIYTLITTNLALLMIGTRTAAYGSIIINIIMLLGYILFNIIISKEKIKTKNLVYYIIIFILFIIVLPYAPVKNRTYAQSEENKIIENLKDKKVQEEYLKISKEKDITIKKDFIINNYRLYGIDESFVTKKYPYNEDYEFYLELMKIPYNKRADHRQLQSLVIKRVTKLNNNHIDYLLGMGFSRLRNSNIYLEKDIYVHIYSIGILGIILFIIPYIAIGIYSFIKIISKKQFNYLNCTLLLSIGLTYFCGIFSGNIFDEWIVTLYLSFICGNLLTNINNPKKYKE